VVVLRPCGGGGRAYRWVPYRGCKGGKHICMCSRRCALASANRPGGGLIGRWRHDGGSGKRGHVRPLSNGHHPPIHPTHSQPRHSPVSPTATLSTPFLLHPRLPRFISSSFSPFIPAPSIARTHLHHTGTTTNTIATITTTTTTTPLTLIHAALNYGTYIGTYRYVYLRTWTWRIYARCSYTHGFPVPPQLYLRMSWIYRARERSR